MKKQTTKKANKSDYLQRKFKRNRYLMDEARMIADLREEYEDRMTKDQRNELNSLMHKAKTMSPADFGLEFGLFILELEKSIKK